MHRLRGRAAAALLMAVAALLLVPAAPAWALPCGPFELDVRHSTRVWVGTIVEVDDASSNFSGLALAQPILRLRVRVQEILKGPPISGLQPIYMNTAPPSASALLGLQTVFALPGRQADGTQWIRLDCQMGTPVAELRRTAAQVLAVPLRTPFPPPSEVLQARHVPWLPVSLVIGAAVLIAGIWAAGRHGKRTQPS